ncbi:MAG: hypothetical protein N2485_00315 [bacterium]|nr:hypothetical protein [bacterium]
MDNLKNMWIIFLTFGSYPQFFHIVIHKKMEFFHKINIIYPHVDKMWITLGINVDNFIWVCG